MKLRDTFEAIATIKPGSKVVIQDPRDPAYSVSGIFLGADPVGRTVALGAPDRVLTYPAETEEKEK